MTIAESDLIKRFDRIRVWQRGSQRAVHKPLLVLLALGRLWRGEPPTAQFVEIESDLQKLLEQFGPSSASASRHYPFWHLRTDGLWNLAGPSNILDRPPAATPNLTELREGQVSGGFPPEVLDALRRNPTLILRMARRLVDAHFPDSLQQDVLNAVGLESGSDEVVRDSDRPRRDPSFRARVLLAYEYCCCVCGHDLRLEGEVVGLEAAHIQWFQAGGPDVEPNGLALCSLHHKLFDLGVFTVLAHKYTMVVSQHVTGGEQAKSRMLGYHGAGLMRPQSVAYLPRVEFLEWHKEEVFKAPSREL